MHIFHVQNGHICTFSLKSDATIMLFNMDFVQKFGDSQTFEADIYYRIKMA